MFLTVFVTAECPLSCGHCFYKEKSGMGAEILSLDEYRRITRLLPSVPKVILTGGEPFMRDDLSGIAGLFYDGPSRSRQLTVPTSGFHPDKIVSFTDRLLASHPDLILEIQLSIDGPAETHDRIRGKGSFERMMSTWRRLEEAERRSKGRLVIRFNFTYSALNENVFEETQRFVSGLPGGPAFDMVLVRGKTADPTCKIGISIEKYKKAARSLNKADMHRLGGTFTGRLLAKRAFQERLLIAAHYLGEQKLHGCEAGRLFGILGETGEVFPCEMSDYSFGNLRENGYDFHRIWRSTRAVDFRSDSKFGGCFCTFETAVRTTMSFQLKFYAGMLPRPFRPSFFSIRKRGLTETAE